MDYRINGFRQISAFYEWLHNNQDIPVKPHHISIYFYILQESNRQNWVEWIKFRFSDAMTGAAIGSKQTYYNAIKDLREWKLIHYKAGTNSLVMPAVSIIQLYKNEPLRTPLPEPVPTHVPEPVPEPLPEHIYITSNNKQVTGNTPMFDFCDSVLNRWETLDKSQIISNIVKGTCSSAEYDQWAVNILCRTYRYIHEEPTATYAKDYVPKFMGWARQQKFEIVANFCESCSQPQPEFVHKRIKADNIDWMLANAQEIISNGSDFSMVKSMMSYV